MALTLRPYLFFVFLFHPNYTALSVFTLLKPYIKLLCAVTILKFMQLIKNWGVSEVNRTCTQGDKWLRQLVLECKMKFQMSLILYLLIELLVCESFSSTQVQGWIGAALTVCWGQSIKLHSCSTFRTKMQLKLFTRESFGISCVARTGAANATRRAGEMSAKHGVHTRVLYRFIDFDALYR